LTITEKYYAMNNALNIALKAAGITARVYKYGVVPKDNSYPYFQSSPRVTYRQPYAKESTGVYTEFEYILNFFTAAANDEVNDADLFIPYEAARELITSPDIFIWSGIADVLQHTETPQFNFKGGLEVLQRGLVFECQTVTTFVLALHGGTEVSIDNVVDTIKNSLSEE